MTNFNFSLDSLHENGFFISDNFFPEKLANNLASSFNERNFISSGIGSTKQVNSSIRKDSISWIDNNEPSLIIQEYISFINNLKNTLNENFFLNLNDFEAHYAHYFNGGFYKKHLDNIQGKNSRILTFITYFNKNWNPSHGGELVIYHQDNKIVVPPKFNTFVCFLSDSIEHEVSPSSTDRLSITGWLKRNSSVM